MVISKTSINKRIPRKKDNYIVDTLFISKNSKKWQSVAQIISGSRRKYSAVNIGRIEKESSEGDLIVVPGKVLGNGNLSKKLKVCALYFSESAVDKIKQNKGEVVQIIDEIKNNPNAEGVKLIR
ncbi:50S ribosomal protein L18e [Candidatus Pacearchaeota archaeon]|nr:50S ribosomal protein L18e [Candidatus Pacearchaeota archaeon]